MVGARQSDSLVRSGILSIMVSLVLVAVLVAADTPTRRSDASLAAEILRATGVEGGLIVHLGCGHGELTAALRAGDAFLVHGLETAAKNVQQAREHIQSLGLYGPVAVEGFYGERLPYVDNLVNLVVVEDVGDVPMEEVMRVLCPNGVAYVKQGEKWTKTVKPRPDEIDEWTHYLHDATGNAVADDDVVDVPRHIQWVGGPRWSRSFLDLPSFSGLVSSGGRMFYFVDEGPRASIQLPPEWFLTARDAFNGVILWKRPIATWESSRRYFYDAPFSLHRRLVAVDNVVYATLGYGQPVTALDAGTGREITVYRGTEGTREILRHENLLLLVIGDPNQANTSTAGTLMALRADTGDVAWRLSGEETKGVLPLSLAACGDRAVFLNGEELVCLDLATGKAVWRRPRTVPQKPKHGAAATVVMYGEVVLSADTRLQVHSTRTGELLWSDDHLQRAYNCPPDVLVTDGLVWLRGFTEARDIMTGKVERRLPQQTSFYKAGVYHPRCFRSRATSRYLVQGKVGAEFINIVSGRCDAHHWFRGTCRYGVLPCNGLVYAPPHSCACYMRAMLNGFNALAPTRESRPAGPRLADSSRLQRGPAYSPLADRQSPDLDPRAWPTYRHDGARSGSTRTTVPIDLARVWRTDLGGRLSAPVVAEGKVFVASVDTHTVHALDANNGQRLWSFIAGGRVDSPPTIHQGLAFFGCADGWVYCVGASDGRLAWRFRAAPEDLRIVSYGRLESAWPVHGSVLVQGDNVYFAAGRSSYLDGGIFLFELDAITGECRSKSVVSTGGPKPLEHYQKVIVDYYEILEGLLPDVLSSDGKSIFIRQTGFDMHWKQREESDPHLFSPTGFLDDSWWVRSYMLLGKDYYSGWWNWFRMGNHFPAGRLLVFDGDSVYGYGRNKYTLKGTSTDYGLFAAPRNQPLETPVRIQQNESQVESRVKHRWANPVDLQPRAMVLADKTLFLAGPPGTAFRSQSAFEGKKGIALWAVDARDGRKLAEYDLDAVPVHDGMAAAGGRLYIATLDGRLTCMGKSSR